MIDIRPMSDSDYPRLVELWERFPGNTLTGADDIEGIRLFLRDNGEYCYTAVDEGLLVGSVMAGSDSRRGYIYHLAVDPDYHNRGVGRLLMGASEESLRRSGIEKAHLFIYTDNPAIRFYERIGWHVRDDIEVMSKVLIGDRYMGTRMEKGPGQGSSSEGS